MNKSPGLALLLTLSLLSSACSSEGPQYNCTLPDAPCGTHLPSELLTSFLPPGDSAHVLPSPLNESRSSFHCQISIDARGEFISLYAEIEDQRPDIRRAISGSELFRSPDEVSVGEEGLVDESRGGAFGPCIASEEEGYLVIAIETRTDAGTAIDQRKAMEDLLRAFYREASSFLRCA